MSKHLHLPHSGLQISCGLVVSIRGKTARSASVLQELGSGPRLSRWYRNRDQALSGLDRAPASASDRLRPMPKRWSAARALHALQASAVRIGRWVPSPAPAASVQYPAVAVWATNPLYRSWASYAVSRR